jgi:hypothetical protein
MIARIWRGYTKPEHAAAYESMLKPELLPGISKVAGYRAATCFEEKLATKSSSLQSCSGTRLTQSRLWWERTMKLQLFPTSDANTCRATTRNQRTTRLRQPRS